MSDKQDNLNQDNENTRFDTVSEKAVDDVDKVKKATAPLTDTADTPSTFPTEANEQQSTVPDTALMDDKTPKSKPADLLNSIPSITTENNTDDNRVESDVKPDHEANASNVPTIEPQAVEHPVESGIVDDVEQSSNDDTDDSSAIHFSPPIEDVNDTSKTISRRAKLDPLHSKGAFLTFNKNKKEDDTPEKNPDTAILSNTSATWRKVIDAQSQGTTSTLGEQREVLFVIRGMIERVVMKDHSTVTLGRFDTGTVANEEIDLIPYGAIDRGVSRRHCKIQLQDNQIYVTDLQSTNGTFLAGVRLNPNEATVLRKGDELLLGRLAVQVLFR